MGRLAAAAAAALLLSSAALLWPGVGADQLANAVRPDSYDYAYGAAALLHGEYLVSWEGTPRLPFYPPGMSVLLVPAVALGGVRGAVWVAYAAALVLGGLVGLMAARLTRRPLVAPLAVALVMFTPATRMFSHMIMSDLVSAVFILLGGLAVALTGGRRGAVCSGVLLGSLVWLREANAPLAAAGLVGLTGHPNWRGQARWYLAGAAIPLALLLAWHWAAFGAPYATGYDTGLPMHWDFLDSSTPRFGLQYVFGGPAVSGPVWLGGSAQELGWPSALIYPFQLAGGDGFLLWPGVGLVGLRGALRLARRRTPEQQQETIAFARYVLAVIGCTFAVTLPYYYQHGRFYLAAAIGLGLIAAMDLADCLAPLARMYKTRWPVIQAMSAVRRLTETHANTATCSSEPRPSS